MVNLKAIDNILGQFFLPTVEVQAKVDGEHELRKVNTSHQTYATRSSEEKAE